MVCGSRGWCVEVMDGVWKSLLVCEVIDIDGVCKV